MRLKQIELRVLVIIILISVAYLNIGGCGGGNESQRGSNKGFVCPRCFTPYDNGLCVCSCTDLPDGTSRSCNACSFLGFVFNDFCEESKSPCPTSPCPPEEESATVLNDQMISEYVTISPLENGCDIYAREYSEYKCEEFAYVRQCESMEITQYEENSMQIDCWLYDCQDCLLTSPFSLKQQIEMQSIGKE